MFVVHKKNTENGILLIVTDKAVHGQCHIEGRKQLDLTSAFYFGEEVSSLDADEFFKAYMLHLSGEEAVAFAESLGMVDHKLVIAGVPHAQVVVER